MTNTNPANTWQADATTASGQFSGFPVQLVWSAIALLLGAVLLFSFYQVTQQAVARAQTHWAQAVQQSDECTSTAAARCGASGKSNLEGLVVSQATRR